MRLLPLFLFALLAMIPAAQGQTPQSLLDAGELSVDSSLQAGPLVPGQRGELVVEVATRTWFSGGTRIRLPEVPGLVILQSEQFAANASETRNGETWVIQRWTLDVYPQRAGAFTVPPIALTVQVNDGARGEVSGQISAPEVNFTAVLPPALAQADFWVAAPAFEATQTVDRDIAELATGDAFTRTIAFRAQDVQAMMLPAFSEEAVAGLAAYPSPPALENRVNRGRTTATRVQDISYVAEQAGTYLLPQQDYFWWNTQTRALEVVTLPKLEVQVVGAGSAAADSAPAIDRKQLLVIAGGLACFAVLAWAILRLRPWRLLRPYREPAVRLWQHLLALRKPALPERLNPGSNAGE